MKWNVDDIPVDAVPAKEYPDLLVTPGGDVFRADGFKYSISERGNRSFRHIYYRGKKKFLAVDKLVLTTFQALSVDCEYIRHKDNDPLNNKIGNLEWVSKRKRKTQLEVAERKQQIKEEQPKLPPINPNDICKEGAYGLVAGISRRAVDDLYSTNMDGVSSEAKYYHKHASQIFFQSKWFDFLVSSVGANPKYIREQLGLD